MTSAACLGDFSKLRTILSKAKNIVVLTGAGTSAESGIPTFRGSGGFWRTYQSQDLATYSAFEKSPSLVWEFYHYRRELVLTKQPNKAHYAIAETESLLEKVGRKLTVVTQNIDGLHQRAGSKNVIELHGSLYKTFCLKCHDVAVNFDSPICPALKGLGSVLLAPKANSVDLGKRHFSTSTSKFKDDKAEIEKPDEKDNMKVKLKRFITQYGPIVMVVHIGNSLVLLGIIYSIISCGLDLTWILTSFGVEESSGKLEKGGTFVIAYAINKVLAPVRFGITFAATPILVRYLRKVGLFKSVPVK